MQSYDEWKARKTFLEHARTVPYIPSSERNPIGNGLSGIAHRVGHKTDHPPFNSTAPSTNSGGMVRKQDDWETIMRNKFQKMDQPAIKEIPRAGLGHQGMSILSKTSFPEYPSMQGDQLGSFKGQFEWKNYLNRRESEKNSKKEV
jgi:hypothetical protein